MSIKRVSATEAFTLMQREGYLYVDVRSVPEFEAAHPAGAYNVPLREPAVGGLADNPAFLQVMEGLFSRDQKLVIGCAAGVRSLRACELLEQVGYACVVDQRAGMDGVRDPFGRVREAGWPAASLPVAQGADDERSYRALRSRVSGTER
jgi:rhodanese-related sulfurtransferase